MADNGEGTPQNLRLVGGLAGMGSGLTKVAVGHGFDTIKTRIQCSPAGTYSSAFDVLRRIIRNEGFFALYKGVVPPAVGWTAIDSVLLGSLHNYRLFLTSRGMTEIIAESDPDTKRLTLVGHGVAGLLAGLTSAVVATPMELLKIKLQLQVQRQTKDRQFKGPVDCARQIVRYQGMRGLWTGLPGSFAFRANFFWMFLSFEVFMRAFSSLNGTPFEIGVGPSNFLAGGLGSIVFWSFGIPADNIKNRMMAHPYPLPYASKSASSSSVSFGLVMRQIYASDGFKGYFRGLGPSLLRAFPSNASAIFVYESIMRNLNAEKTRL